VDDLGNEQKSSFFFHSLKSILIIPYQIITNQSFQVVKLIKLEQFEQRGDDNKGAENAIDNKKPTLIETIYLSMCYSFLNFIKCTINALAMKSLLFVLCIPSFLLINSARQSVTAIPSRADTTTFPPVETQEPNTDYKPAFAGQTRINGVRTTTPYKVEKIAEKLGRPWAVVPLPDGRLLITEKSGYMEIRAADGSVIKKIAGFPAVDDRGQGGMLDAAPDPAFASNKTIYWSFSEKYGSGNLMAVAKGQLSVEEGTIKNPGSHFSCHTRAKQHLAFRFTLVV
jgi:hypothetical protein